MGDSLSSTVVKPLKRETMCKKRLDSRERLPAGMEKYLDSYGWHFNKRLCDHAVSRMKKTGPNGEEQPYIPLTKEKVEEILKRNNVDFTKFNSHDHVYVMNMLRSDLVEDEATLARYTKKYLCDADGYDEVALTRYYADCIGKGEMPPWEDVY